MLSIVGFSSILSTDSPYNSLYRRQCSVFIAQKILQGSPLYKIVDVTFFILFITLVLVSFVILIKFSNPKMFLNIKSW